MADGYNGAMPAPQIEPEPGRAKTDGRTTGTRERILVAAEDLIAARGVEGFQIKDVAEAVGIRPPSVFAHFKGREAIAHEVARRIIGEIGQLLAAAFAGQRDPMGAARAGARALVAHLYAHPAHVRLLLRDLAQAGAGEGFHGVGDAIAEIDRLLVPVLEWGRSAGVFRDVEVRPLLPMIQGAILTRLAWSGFDYAGRPRVGASLEALQREAEELIVAYLRAPELPCR